MFNSEIYPSLLSKKRRLESKFILCIREKPEDLLSYNIFYPIKIAYKPNKCYATTQDSIDDILKESREKKFHKDIYRSYLFKLINPYYLVENDYLDEKYISKEIKDKFNEERADLIERDYALSPNEFYDKKNQICFGFPSKKNKYYKTRNSVVLKAAVKNCDILVRLKNEDDCFDRNFLLRPSFRVSELKSLISFIYKTVLHVGNPGKINLFYYSDTFSEVYITEDNKTMKEIGKEMKNKFVLDLNINI